MICSLCGYVWRVYAAISSPIVVFRTILVDFGELLGSYVGAMVSLGESCSTIFGVMIGGVFQTLFWGWFLDDSRVTGHAKTLISCDRCIKFMEITNL